MYNVITTNDDIDKKLAKFYKIHLNCKINLTSIKEEQEFYLKHYLDSVYYFEKHYIPDGTLMDVGSGGGFPGIVLGIFYPSLQIALVESIGKKCNFLKEAIKELHLTNVIVINDRVENLKNKNFDIITARGVAPVLNILKNTWSTSKKGTKWVLYKGEKLEEELHQASLFIQKRGLYVEKIRIEEPITRSYCIINR